MPGPIPHLIAGCTLFVIGRYYYRSYFDDNTNDKLLLAIVCIIFSFIPDIFLIIYYSSFIPNIFLGIDFTSNIFSKDMFKPYHNLSHLVLYPVAIAGLIIVRYVVNPKRKPIWIMGLWAIIVHLTMDLHTHGGILPIY